MSQLNDFAFKIATVNGTGSASANNLLMTSIFRMGIPVTGKNIFPSNIQGLPTWYEVRVTEAGYLGRRGGVDMMVAMNPQTWDADVKEIEAGGYLFYDSTRPVPKSKLRDDITVIGMPLTQICNATYTDARERQLFKNIIYVGALAAMIGMDVEAIEKLIGEQYKGKEKLIDSNVKALGLGRDYATRHLDAKACKLKVRKADNVGDRIFVGSLRHQGLKAARTREVTVNYLCTWASLFLAIGETPPDYAKSQIDGNRVAISAEVKRESPEKPDGERVLRSERFYGQMARSPFTLLVLVGVGYAAWRRYVVTWSWARISWFGKLTPPISSITVLSSHSLPLPGNHHTSRRPWCIQ